jgi:hypothetical protein
VGSVTVCLYRHMVITLSNPTAGFVGQGHELEASTTVAMSSAGVSLWELMDPTLTWQVSAASGDTPSGVGLFAVQMGLQQGSPAGFRQGIAAGAAVTLRITLFSDQFLTVIDSGIFAGVFLHDPVSGLGGLLGQVGGLTSGQQSELDDILANTQGGTFKSPLIGTMTTVADAGSPVTGGSVVNLTPPVPVTTVGLTWEVVTAAPAVGGTVGVIEHRNRRVMQAVVFHSLLGGATFADQVFEGRGDTGAFFFDSWEPTGVSVYIWPGFIVNISWLLF